MDDAKTDRHPANSENFSLLDFFKTEGRTLAARVKPFGDYLHAIQSQGEALYAREICGPTGPRVKVRDARTGEVREMIMMGSNNYLGFANHPEVNDAVKNAVDHYGVGMGGAPLLNGMSSVHRVLEKRLAGLKGKEDAMLFASGFQANLAWASALLRSQDLLICDELHHASFFDGLRLARAAHRMKVATVRHNDIGDLEANLEKGRAKIQGEGQIFVAVEGVYSMDGDLAPLDEIARLCEAFGANLIVDDAHGTGVLGVNGGGTAEHFGVSEKVALAMGTFSKAFGVTGGFLAGSSELIEYLRYFSRPYMFSAHLPQSIAAGVVAGLDLIQKQPELRKALHDHVAYFVRGLNRMGFPTQSQSAIIPVLIREDADIRRLGKRLHEEGLFANIIEYPAVPRDAQRVRLSVMANHTKQDLDFALDVMERVGKELGLIG